MSGAEGGDILGHKYITETGQGKLLQKKPFKTVIFNKAVPGKVKQMGIGLWHAVLNEFELILDVILRRYILFK